MLYSIEISGNGAEVGIHKLTNAQYDFWTAEENNSFLAEALVEDYSSLDDSVPDGANYSDSYLGLRNIDTVGGGYLGGLMIEISPIPEDDEDVEDLYSFDDELNDFIASLSKPQYKQIVNVEEYQLPTIKGIPSGYLIWKAEETGIFLQGEIDVGEGFDLKKLKLNFRKVNEDIFLESASYDDCDLDFSDSWELGDLLDAEIVEI